MLCIPVTSRTDLIQLNVWIIGLLPLVLWLCINRKSKTNLDNDLIQLNTCLIGFDVKRKYELFMVNLSLDNDLLIQLNIHIIGLVHKEYM